LLLLLLLLSLLLLLRLLLGVVRLVATPLVPASILARRQLATHLSLGHRLGRRGEGVVAAVSLPRAHNGLSLAAASGSGTLLALLLRLLLALLALLSSLLPLLVACSTATGRLPVLVCRLLLGGGRVVERVAAGATLLAGTDAANSRQGTRRSLTSTDTLLRKGGWVAVLVLPLTTAALVMGLLLVVWVVTILATLAVVAEYLGWSSG
jgi:hypothetical protein